MFEPEQEQNQHTLILMDIKDHEWEFTCNVNYKPQYQEKCPDCGSFCIWAKRKVTYVPRQETTNDV